MVCPGQSAVAVPPAYADTSKLQSSVLYLFSRVRGADVHAHTTVRRMSMQLPGLSFRCDLLYLASCFFLSKVSQARALQVPVTYSCRIF